MASCRDPELPNGGSIQEEMTTKSGKYQQYPPPQALPDYVNRALPPPPPPPRSNSSTPSIYYSPGEGTQAPVEPVAQPPVAENEQESLSPTHADVPDEAGLSTVQPLQTAITATPPRSQEHSEIVAPQPRYPASKVLEVKNYVVSPVSAPLPENSSGHQPYDEVSPVSPDGSERSLRSRISESSRPSSPARGNASSSIHRTPTNKSERRRAVYESYRAPTHASGGHARSPRYQVHQINDRYSDPGSPITGAVLHPPTSFPSDPSLRSSRQLSAARRRASQGHHGGNGASEDDDAAAAGGAKLTPVASAGSSTRVAFAGLRRNDSGFAARPRRAGSRRTAVPPPPLKLGERPLVDGYVSTPFPTSDLGGGEEEEEEEEEGEGLPRSRFSHGRESSSEDMGRRAWTGMGKGKGKGKEKDREKEKEKEGEDRKKRNRVSSLPGFGLGLGFARVLRSGSLNGGSKREKEGGGKTPRAAAVPSEVRAGYVETRAPPSRVPSRTPSMSKVKDMLSKAKRQIGLGHGLGVGMMSSEEAKKERRKAEMKRQIRVGEPRPA
ncbi:hypothetical protein F4818DRAFT_452555 [Hypoxylon cercidicola]|nr:hypothetical protein F4818DRAFT_452555 [Hypoxylon cercidicola]